MEAKHPNRNITPQINPPTAFTIGVGASSNTEVDRASGMLSLYLLDEKASLCVAAVYISTRHLHASDIADADSQTKPSQGRCIG